MEPGSLGLPPTPPAWRLAWRLTTIAQELAAMRWRYFRGVPIEVRARMMREALVRLGPAFVKGGQVIRFMISHA